MDTRLLNKEISTPENIFIFSEVGGMQNQNIFCGGKSFKNVFDEDGTPLEKICDIPLAALLSFSKSYLSVVRHLSEQAVWGRDIEIQPELSRVAKLKVLQSSYFSCNW